MSTEMRNMLIVMGSYVVFTVCLALGGYLFLAFPQYEALGGVILGLTGIVLGLLLPYHLWKTKVVEFAFLPPKQGAAKVGGGTLLFAVVLLGLFPSGMLGDDSTFRFLTNPPAPIPALMTFLFLLLSAATYALLFWGGILHSVRKVYGSMTAVIVTGLLFSLYHLAEFAFTPLTLNFLFTMFISGILCAAFTFYAQSILPTLIVQQCTQFVYFASLPDNPFAGVEGVVATTVMLLICTGLYRLLTRTRRIAAAV